MAAALGFIVYQGLANNLVYYITPSELLAKGASADGGNFRLGGQVRPGSVHWNGTTKMLSFVLQDPKASVAVVSHGIPPALFQNGIGCVVEGVFSNHRFDATSLMIKHSGTYVAPKPGQTPLPDNFVSRP